jgi:hypothetical protein
VAGEGEGSGGGVIRGAVILDAVEVGIILDLPPLEAEYYREGLDDR